ncbi:S8 family serine peptidase [bacterium]|nr:S8 family serine peptidase [bacterium]
MNRIRKYQGAILVALMVLLVTTVSAADKIKIEKLDDLPRYTYKIDQPAVDFLHDDAAVAALANEVEADLISDLETYQIDDKTTLKNYYADLGSIALLEGRYMDYLGFVDKRIELEEKEALKLTTALYTRALCAAKISESDDFEGTLKSELENLVNPLPYDVVGDVIKSSKGTSEIYSLALIEGQVMSGIQPTLDGSDGEMSKDIATSLIGLAQTIRNYLPYKHVMTEVYGAYLDEHKVVKEDIWEERDFALKEGMDAAPVVIAVWDSGVDEDIFAPMGRMWVNKDEIPGNDIDDDGNGYVDDVHGIAYDLHSNKTQSLLYPIGDVEADRPRLQRMMKGLEDITSGIDSEEAAELKEALSKLERDQVKTFIEDISKYGNYAHGTHVAGIAQRDNAFARVLGCRLTFGHTMIPELPTVELARAEAKMYGEVIDYFKAAGVRVVNMSWGGSVGGIESALEANNAGETPDERKAMAREIFEISRDGLYNAIQSAPEILFVTSAGNADNDVTFEEFLPSSFDLPNIMSVGAVDQAGDETDFTSFGKVDVYANGFEVLSYVPGGDQLKMSGTSMSSPNVTNLVSKLLAVNPSLSPTQVRELIIKGSDVMETGDRTIVLMNPKKSLMLLSQMKGDGKS